MGNQCCGTNKVLENAGSILDRVISQSSNEDQCLLYKLANYKKGGELIDAYTTGGQAEVEKLIRDKFGQLLYANGQGKKINRAEYLRWKFRDQKQVILPIEASLSVYDPLAKWEDHEACWQMQYRGSLGETLLHVLIICDTRVHTKLARILLKCFPKQALDIVEGEEYLGASALHLAIAYSNNELVEELVEAGANVNQRALGSFFLPKDQQRTQPLKNTDYEGLAYLGEYPLSWAACCANESVYNLLLDSGSHPDLQDRFGNMILHMVVVCDKLDMFGYALRHPRLPASNGIVNKAGLTPLTLACKLGRAEVFREMLELSAKEFWRYSNITCSAYPLNALDTLSPDGKTNWNSALFIILNGTKEEHLEMLDGGIIQRLLEEKWKTFARIQFMKRLLILMLHLLCLSGAVYFRPKDSEESLLAFHNDFASIARYTCEFGTLAGVLSYVVLQQGDEIKNQGFWPFLKQQSHSPPKAIFLVSNLLILACIPCRIYGDKDTEEAILVFAVPGSWFLLMFFAGAVRLTGPFVTMIYSMITGDMLTFGIIYMIVLFGFSQSFYFLYKDYPGVKNTLYHSYHSTWMAMFQITLGDYNYSDLSLTSYPTVSKTVFTVFMVFVPILLLNMLIAMMGNTYAHVIEQSEKEWMKQWAKIVVSLERAVSQSDARRYIEEYSIRLGPGDEPGTEQRGVMVIKSKAKTRAKQRKGALANWKHVGKVTIKALKKRGLTGEQMRCLMWGRESISTPVKAKKKRGGDPYETGPSLTAALDVMAFVDDKSKDSNVAFDPLNPLTSLKPSAVSNATPQDPNPPSYGVTIQPVGILTNKRPSLDRKKKSVSYEDPLRQLIILENSNATETMKTLETLAGRAADLCDVDETVKVDASATDADKTGLLGMFLDAPTVIDHRADPRKDVLLDDSDFDDLGGTPLLGNRERQRRALYNVKPNISCSDFSSTDRDGPARTSYRRLSKDSKGSRRGSAHEADSANERIREIKESLRANESYKIEDLRPVHIDVALGLKCVSMADDKYSSTSSEVEADSKHPKTHHKRLRPKTAKNNRVFPGQKPRRSSHSARVVRGGNERVVNQSPPDFLEPWSTKEIGNMETILPWSSDDG